MSDSNDTVLLSGPLSGVQALAAKSSHVPFRDSKLTALLQDSLSGNAKAMMFIHIAPEVHPKWPAAQLVQLPTCSVLLAEAAGTKLCAFHKGL